MSSEENTDAMIIAVASKKRVLKALICRAVRKDRQLCRQDLVVTSDERPAERFAIQQCLFALAQASSALTGRSIHGSTLL